MNQYDRVTVFPVWLQNTLAALAILFVVFMTYAMVEEYILLASTEGDAGYPFGCEEAGPGYATKEIYLARSRWHIAIGATLSLAMLYALCATCGALRAMLYAPCSLRRAMPRASPASKTPRFPSPVPERTP
jgi:hypothetical protein